MQSFWLSEGVIVIHSSSQTKLLVVLYLITGIYIHALCSLYMVVVLLTSSLAKYTVKTIIKFNKLYTKLTIKT